MTLNIGLVIYPDTHILTIADAHNAISKYHPVSIFNYRDYPTNAHVRHELNFKFEFSNKKYFRLAPFRQVDFDVVPDLVVYWDEEEYEPLYDFLRKILDHEDIDKDFDDVVEKLKAGYVTAFEDGINYYNYEQYFDEQKKWMYCQIDRPNDDLPFTVILKDFEKTGLEPLFAHIFYSQAWGLFRDDYRFLEQLWDHFGMEGKYDHEQLMKKYTERCYPGEEKFIDEEPNVYRRSIKHLTEFVEK